MTTVSQIIIDAYRQSNLIAVGVSPTAAEQDEALRHLNRIVKSTLGNEVGEPLEPIEVPWTGDITSYEQLGAVGPAFNVRLMCNLTSSSTIKLPSRPQDGMRLSIIDVAGNFSTNNVVLETDSRKIEGARQLVLNEDGFDGEWIYQEDFGDWRKVSPLAMDDVFPFGEEFDVFFYTMLAMTLNPAYNIQMNDQSFSLYNRSRAQLRSKYKQTKEVPLDPGLVLLPKTVSGRYPYSSKNDFYKGY